MRKLFEAAENTKVKKLVDEVNKILSELIDSDGDRIPLVDKSGTWEGGDIYDPIIYKGGKLYISYTDYYEHKKHSEVILNKHIEEDGIPTLLYIKKMATKALKNK